MYLFSARKLYIVEQKVWKVRSGAWFCHDRHEQLLPG